MRWHVTENSHVHEASLLYLDSAKARHKLQWEPVWNFNAAVTKTAEWYRAWLEQGAVISREQLIDYTFAARQAKVTWLSP
jgi:CDP-glucose 4,6-dehydratase